MSPLSRLVRDIAKAPDLIGQVLIPAVLGNSIWSMGQIVLPALRREAHEDFPYSKVLIVLTTCFYLLLDFVAASTSQLRRHHAPAVLSIISSTERLVLYGALGVLVIALCPPCSIRVAAGALLTFSIVLTLAHCAKSIYETRATSVYSRATMILLSGGLIAGSGYAVMHPTEMGLRVMALAFTSVLFVYISVPWPHHTSEIPKHLAKSRRAGEELKIRYENPERSDTCVTILAYAPRSHQRRYIQIQLDASGRGETVLSWEPTGSVILDCEDSYPATLKGERRRRRS